MKLRIITGGSQSARILRRLLREEFAAHPDRLALAERDGRSSAVTLARTVLAVKLQPVALVVDADTVDEENLEETQVLLEGVLRSVARIDTWKVFLFKPSIEALFFSDADVLETLLGGPVDLEQRIRGQYEPKKVLGALMKERGMTFDQVEKRLDGDLLAKLASNDVVRDLKLFIAEVLQAVAA